MENNENPNAELVRAFQSFDRKDQERQAEAKRKQQELFNAMYVRAEAQLREEKRREGIEKLKRSRKS